MYVEKEKVSVCSSAFLTLLFFFFFSGKGLVRFHACGTGTWAHDGAWFYGGIGVMYLMYVEKREGSFVCLCVRLAFRLFFLFFVFFWDGRGTSTRDVDLLREGRGGRGTGEGGRDKYRAFRG